MVTYCYPRDEGVKIDLIEEVLGSLLRRRRLNWGRPVVAQDSRVDATGETHVPDIRVSPDPIVVCSLVCDELSEYVSFNSGGIRTWWRHVQQTNSAGQQISE